MRVYKYNDHEDTMADAMGRPPAPRPWYDAEWVYMIATFLFVNLFVGTQVALVMRHWSYWFTWPYHVVVFIYHNVFAGMTW
jgi:hypothetical protein